MRNEFTAVVERHGRWHIAYCPEIPGANGQGKKKAAALKSLRDAIALMCLLLAADPIPRG
jgi:predicted RNase H-like HicB family nuclease